MKKATLYILTVCAAMAELSGAENIDGSRQPPAFTVDASRQLGPFKPLNSVNGGPRINMGLAFDNSEYFREFKPPIVRTHDSAYSDLDTCDVHAIFPNFEADDSKPENYRFDKTDRHIKAILDVGSQVLFRLGESIEHGQPKRYAQPPADFKKWTRICCNIVRHYNQGWANGFQWNIRYWEIWNEPNAMGTCWLGSAEQYYELYRETATALKNLDPNLKVGGPALAGGANGFIGNKFGAEFLEFCRDNKVPLDFVSWHSYTDHPAGLMKSIEGSIAAVRKFAPPNAELFLDEWNYRISVPANVKKTREGGRDLFLRVRGGEGAAYAATMLAFMQETDLSAAFFYAAYGTVFRYGMFDQYGVPSRQFDAFKAFNQVVQCGTRIAVSGNKRETGLGIVAAVDKETGKTAVLLSNFGDEASQFGLELKHLPLKGNFYCTEYVINNTHALTWEREKPVAGGDLTLAVELPKSSVRLILFTPESLKPESGAVSGTKPKGKKN